MFISRNWYSRKKSKNNRFKVYSKLNNLPKTYNKKKLYEFIKKELKKTKNNLGNPCEILFIHNFSDLYRYNHFLIRTLLKLNKDRFFKELGVSVYHPREAIFAMKFQNLKHIQIPFNLLDYRWLDKKFQAKIKKNKKVFFHARSIFLQGLLINKEKFWPSWYDKREKTINLIENAVFKYKFLNKVDLCFSYVSSFNWIKSIILGFDTIDQFKYFDNINNKRIKKRKKFKNHWKSVILKDIIKIVKNKRILLPYSWKSNATKR